MTIKRLWIIIGSSLLGFSITLAQAPNNFQFLDHSRVETTVMDVIVQDDEIIYSSSGGIHKAKYDYELERLEYKDFNKSKLITTSDSSFILYQWGISLNDFGYTGFVQLEQNGEIENYSQIETEYFPDLIDITPDSTGGWWCLTGDDFFSDKIYHFNGDGSIDTSFKSPESFRNKIYTNVLGEIFLYGSFVIGDDNLAHLNDYEQLSISTIDSRSIYDIRIWQGNNAVLTEDKLLITDPAFDTILYTWNLPETIENFNHVEINHDSTLYQKSFSENNYQISKISKSSQQLFTINRTVEEDEIVIGIKMLSDTTHIVYGQRQLEICDNLFFRNVATSEPIEYPVSDVAIAYFKLNKNNLVTSTFSGTAELSLFNNASEVIYNSAAYSTEYIVNMIDDIGPLNLSIPINNLEAQTQQEFTKPINASLSNDFEIFAMEVPGANYKFNISANKYRPVDSVLSTLENKEPEYIDLYPNPASDVLFLPAGITKFLIYNSSGQLVRQSLGHPGKKVDVTELPAGFYHVVFVDEKNNRFVSQVVVW